jgi:tetratricopeptide (TPR) repeat protein
MSYITRLLLGLVFLNAATAQEPSAWLGRKVVTKYTYPVKLGEQVVDDDSEFRQYTVTRVNGDWLWVVSGSIEGWLPFSQVVLFDQAIDFYTREIKLNPANANAYHMRGMIWQDRKELDISISDLNEAIRLDPNQSTFWDTRGQVWGDKKEYDKALGDCNEAIRLDPKSALAYITRGLAWSGKQRYDKAITDYNEAIRLDPKSAMAYMNRGVAWTHEKDYDKAIADYNEVIRLDPKNALASKNRGYAWSNKKEYDKAIADYNEAIGLDPRNADAYNSRAWLWATCPNEKFRDGKKAVESATHACELSEWKDANEVDTLAAAYAESGTFGKAVEFQKKANKLYSDTEDRNKGEERLRLYKENKPYRQPE